MPGHAMAWLPCRARPSRRPSGPVTTPKVHLRDSDVLHALLVLRHGGETMVPPRFGLLGQASPANT
jgi:hypothetical protein